MSLAMACLLSPIQIHPPCLLRPAAELRDFTTNTSLARSDFSVQTTGPAWGSTWFYYNFSLTPSAGTACAGIPFGSDPSIDCGADAGPAHVCVRCGGELVVGLSAPGSVNIGTVSLQPGAWGLLQGPGGDSLPVLASAAAVLRRMGVSLIRSGGSVSQVGEGGGEDKGGRGSASCWKDQPRLSPPIFLLLQSMRWKDWRGAAWNRPSLTATWGESLTAGWGPFGEGRGGRLRPQLAPSPRLPFIPSPPSPEVVDMCNAMGIEPAITLAYDSNDAVRRRGGGGRRMGTCNRSASLVHALTCAPSLCRATLRTSSSTAGATPRKRHGAPAAPPMATPRPTT